MDATSAGSYRIFTGLIVVLGALVFISSTAGAGCPKGWIVTWAVPGQKFCALNSPDDYKAVSCMGACDHCNEYRGAGRGELGGVGWRMQRLRVAVARCVPSMCEESGLPRFSRS